MLKGRRKTAYDFFQKRKKEIEEYSQKNNGKVSMEEGWRYTYYQNPYLLLEDDHTILDRFSDIFTNSVDINEHGKISFTPLESMNYRLAKLFVEILEETNWRGILNKDSVTIAAAQINKCYENGTPVGVKLFESIEEKNSNSLFKFSKKKYIKDMYELGKFRISLASFYSKENHIKAVKDSETIRDYRLPAIQDIIGGSNHFKFQGHHHKIENGIVPVTFTINDYYLFSTCNSLSRRMPTDFNADSVLIIKNKNEFINRVKTELEISYPDWEFLEQNIHYYDPYNDLPTDRNQEFYKHISYAYQKEHRCIIRPKVTPASIKESFYIELGSLKDIAEIAEL